LKSTKLNVKENSSVCFYTNLVQILVVGYAKNRMFWNSTLCIRNYSFEYFWQENGLGTFKDKDVEALLSKIDYSLYISSLYTKCWMFGV